MEYKDLDIWKIARNLTNNVYTLTKNFPKDELFGLTNQIRRCAISIPSNIAEGCGRNTPKGTLVFLYISRGSLFELETQFYLALDQEYMNEENFKIIIEEIQTCKKLLNGFINYYKKIENDKQ